MIRTDRSARAVGVLAALVVFLASIVSWHPPTHAGQSSITQVDAQQVITSGALSSGGTFTSGVTGGLTFRALEHTTAQSVAVRVAGTSPNYKVELLVSLDGINFVKPEVGSLLGTFTDGNIHVVALFAPLHVQNRLLFTELGSHTGTIDAWEASQ